MCYLPSSFTTIVPDLATSSNLEYIKDNLKETKKKNSNLEANLNWSKYYDHHCTNHYKVNDYQV